MRHLNYLVCLFIFTAPGIYCWGQARDNNKEVKPPQATLAIFFERNSVEIGDSFFVVVQVINQSGYQLSDLQLVMDGPGFVQLNGAQATPNHPIRFGDLSAYSALKRNQLPLIVSSKALVGDFNLVFTLSYQWKADQLVYQSKVTAEKPLKIGLFGTDKVIGVPLAFAQFIVPGLFFLSLLGMFKIPVVQALGAHEKLIMSVLVSVVCLFLVDIIGKKSGWKWTQQLDQGGAISIEKLFLLALSGIVLGLLVLLFYYCYRWWLERQKAKMVFRGDETDIELIQKALQLNPKYEGFPWQFTCKDGTTYMGSHYFETDFSYVLLAAFKIEKETLTPEEKAKIDKHSMEEKLLQTGKHLLAVIAVIDNSSKVKLSVRNPVKKIVVPDPIDVGLFYTINKDEFRSKQHTSEKNMRLVELI